MKVTGKVWVFYNAESGKQTKPLSTVQAQMALLSLKERDFRSIHIWTPGWENWQPVQSFLSSGQTVFALTQPPKPERQSTRSKSSKSSVADVIDEITNTLSGNSSSESPYTEVEDIHSVKSRTDYGYFHQDFNGEDLDLSKIRKVVKSVKFRIPKHNEKNSDNKRRTSIRHDFKLEIVLFSDERSFRTYSQNISLGGTLLEDEIPKGFLNKSFSLIIINKFEQDPNKRQLLFKAKIVGDITNPRRLMFLEADLHMVARLDALLKAYITYQEQIRKQTG